MRVDLRQIHQEASWEKVTPALCSPLHGVENRELPLLLLNEVSERQETNLTGVAGNYPMSSR